MKTRNIVRRAPVENSGVNISGTKGYPFYYVADLPATGSGQNNSAPIAVDASNDFEVAAIMFCANFSTGVTVVGRSNIAGGVQTGGAVDANGVGNTPTANFESLEFANMVKLPRSGPATAAQQTMPGLHHLRLGIKTNDRDWMNLPVRADLLTSEPGVLFFFPKAPIIKANSTVVVTMYNDMPLGSVDGLNRALRGIKGNAAGTIQPTVNAQFVLFGSKLVRGS